MKLLLDTHIWLWSLLEPGKLRKRVIREMESPDNELWLSPVSTWEVVMLSEKGRIEIDGDVEEWIREALKGGALHEAPMTHDVAIEAQRVHLAHRDPADRLLIATARAFNLTLVTADTRLIRSKDVPVLANR